MQQYHHQNKAEAVGKAHGSSAFEHKSKQRAIGCGRAQIPSAGGLISVERRSGAVLIEKISATKRGLFRFIFFFEKQTCLSGKSVGLNEMGNMPSALYMKE